MSSIVANRAAWSRIELLVIVALTLTACGLVVSLLFQSRGRAARVECMRNLELIGKAFHGFHTEQKTLPASYIAPGYATWAAQIARYLPSDNGSVLKDWDFQLSYFDQAETVRGGQIDSYYCPARRTAAHLSISGDVPPAAVGQSPNFPGALGDYGCAPTSTNTARPWDSPEADGACIVGEVLDKQENRVIRWKARTTLAMLLRGESYTILLGEKHVPAGDLGKAQFGDGSIYNGDNTASFARLVDIDHPLAQGPADTFKLNFGSWHAGVCQFVMADGSVRVISNDTDPEMVKMLIPRGLPKAN